VLLSAVRDSLRRLRTDYIDLYYVHVDDRSTAPYLRLDPKTVAYPDGTATSP
jgi:aryl-alcohol dehydrogenase-like predicted oxidoreductase